MSRDTCQRCVRLRHCRGHTVGGTTLKGPYSLGCSFRTGRRQLDQLARSPQNSLQEVRAVRAYTSKRSAMVSRSSPNRWPYWSR